MWFETVLVLAVSALFTQFPATAFATSSLPVCVINGIKDIDFCHTQFTYTLPAQASLTQKCCGMLVYRHCMVNAVNKHCDGLITYREDITTKRHFYDKFISSIGFKSVKDCAGHTSKSQCEPSKHLYLIVFVMLLVLGFVFLLFIFIYKKRAHAERSCANGDIPLRDLGSHLEAAKPLLGQLQSQEDLTSSVSSTI